MHTNSSPILDEERKSQVWEKYTRCEAVCSSSFAPVLTLKGKCLQRRANPAHLVRHLPTMPGVWCTHIVTRKRTEHRSSDERRKERSFFCRLGIRCFGIGRGTRWVHHMPCACACPRPGGGLNACHRTRTSTRHCPYAHGGLTCTVSTHTGTASHAPSRFPLFAKIWGAPQALFQDTGQKYGKSSGTSQPNWR